MNAPPALLHLNPREAPSGLGPVWRTAAECGPAAAGRGPEVGGGRQEIWRVHTYGLGGLQPLEIPQNGQRFVWKSLDENSLDLEKLVETLGRPPLLPPVAPVSNSSSASGEWRRSPSAIPVTDRRRRRGRLTTD